MDASKTDISRWEVVVNGEGCVTRAGCTIVTMDLIDNKNTGESLGFLYYLT